MSRTVRIVGVSLALAVAAACGGSTSEPGSSPSSPGPTDTPDGDAEEAGVDPDGGSVRDSAAAPSDAADAAAASDSADAAVACGPPLTQCPGVCTLVEADPKNCGGCGTKCTPGQACIAKTCATTVTFVVHKMFWGDTDRAGVYSTNAWKAFGANLDGLQSTTTSTDVCQLTPGAPNTVKLDGNLGIDNSFGNMCVPIASSVYGISWPATYGAGLLNGKGAFLLDLPGYAGQTNLAVLTVRALVAADVPTKPKLDGSDSWPVVTTTFDALGKAKATFDVASITGGVLDTGPRSGTLTVPSPFGPLPIQKPRITATISATGMTNGTISGVLPTALYLAAARPAYEREFKGMCAADAWANITGQTAQAQDILADATQDPTKPCEAISIGLGFEAVPVKLGDVVLPPVLPDPCK